MLHHFSELFSFIQSHELIFLFLFILLLFLLKKYFSGGVCKIKSDLTSKIILITGANRGIGQYTASQLSKIGGTVIMACRDIRKAEEAKKEIIKATNNYKIDSMYLDLSDMNSVRDFVEKFKAKYQRLDILINNAGLLNTDRKITKEGFEMMIATNHLGHFLLTNLLLDLLKASSPSRVITLSSLAHTYGHLNLDDINAEKFYFSQFTYGGTKLANILFTNELALRLEGTGVKTCSLHPGVIRSGFIENVTRKSMILKILIVIFYPFWWFFTKSIEEGSQTTLYCALLPHEELKNGKFYCDCKISSTKAIGNDKTLMKRLWEISEKMVA